ncbi:MAG: hypothetical protein DRP25_00070, partial [Thermotoga sp.]
MKRLLFSMMVLIPVFILCAEIKDVSPGLDVYEAVNYVVDKGIMELDSKGYFRGALLITRFDLAQYLYNLINVFSLDELSKMKGIPEEVGVIKNTFVALDTRVSKIEKRIEEVVKSLEDLPKLQQKLENVEKFEKDLESEIKGLKREISSVRSSISVLRNELEGVKRDLPTVKSKISNVERAFSGKVKFFEENISVLKDTI